MKFTNKVYDTLKWIARYLLPGIGTLYFTLAELWKLPYTAEVVGTLSALTVFIGMLLGISSSGYEGDGTLKIVDEGEAELELDENAAVEDGKLLSIKVKEG